MVPVCAAASLGEFVGRVEAHDSADPDHLNRTPGIFRRPVARAGEDLAHRPAAGSRKDKNGRTMRAIFCRGWISRLRGERQRRAQSCPTNENSRGRECSPVTQSEHGDVRYQRILTCRSALPILTSLHFEFELRRLLQDFFLERRNVAPESSAPDELQGAAMAGPSLHRGDERWQYPSTRA